MEEDNGADNFIGNQKRGRHQGLSVELLCRRIPPGRRIIDIHRSALADCVDGYRAVRSPQAATNKVGRHKAIGFPAYQFVGRLTSPEVRSICTKEFPGRVTEKANQTLRPRSLGCRLGQSEEQLLKRIFCPRAGFVQHCRISRTRNQKGHRLRSTTSNGSYTKNRSPSQFESREIAFRGAQL